MKELIQNAEEFLESGEDNFKKKRFNAAVSDFFKAVTNYCDWLIYLDTKIIIKNHNERFNFLKKYHPKIHMKILEFYKKYRESYNLRLSKEDAYPLKEFANELKRDIKNKG